MGASQSRARLGSGPKGGKKGRLGLAGGPGTSSAPAHGYFILSLKGDKIKVVNASTTELKILTALIRRHCTIVNSGWDRHLTFSFRLKKSSRHCVIQLVADALLELYTAGWEPMTPIDMGVKGQENSTTQTAICFKKRETAASRGLEEDPDLTGSKDTLGSSFSLSGLPPEREKDSCMCLETYQSNYLGFLNASNTVLYDLVNTVKQEWLPGIAGISMAVSSVISDYSRDTPEVLPGQAATTLQDAKYMKLNGHPWSASAQEGRDLEDTICAENLELSIIACLSRHQYKLSMAINMDSNSRVFFFIRDTADSTGHGEVRIPTFGVGLGEKDGMSVYRPMVTRSKSSFFRAIRKSSIKSRIRKSLRKKAVVGKPNTVMSYKPQVQGTAWWQQTSTDVSSDHDG